MLGLPASSDKGARNDSPFAKSSFSCSNLDTILSGMRCERTVSKGVVHRGRSSAGIFSSMKLPVRSPMPAAIARARLAVRDAFEDRKVAQNTLERMRTQIASRGQAHFRGFAPPDIAQHGELGLVESEM